MNIFDAHSAVLADCRDFVRMGDVVKGKKRVSIS
jgi:hypothetical protein